MGLLDLIGGGGGVPPLPNLHNMGRVSTPPPRDNPPFLPQLPMGGPSMPQQIPMPGMGAGSPMPQVGAGGMGQDQVPMLAGLLGKILSMGLSGGGSGMPPPGSPPLTPGMDTLQGSNGGMNMPGQGIGIPNEVGLLGQPNGVPYPGRSTGTSNFQAPLPGMSPQDWGSQAGPFGPEMSPGDQYGGMSSLLPGGGVPGTVPVGGGQGGIPQSLLDLMGGRGGTSNFQGMPPSGSPGLDQLPLPVPDAGGRMGPGMPGPMDGISTQRLGDVGPSPVMGPYFGNRPTSNFQGLPPQLLQLLMMLKGIGGPPPSSPGFAGLGGGR